MSTRILYDNIDNNNHDCDNKQLHVVSALNKTFFLLNEYFTEKELNHFQCVKHYD